MARKKAAAPEAPPPAEEVVVEPTPPPIPAPEMPPPPRPRRDPIPNPVIPKNEAELINNVVCREIVDPSGVEIDADPTLAILEQLIKGITTGADLTPIEDEVKRVLNHAQEKQQVILAVLRSHDYVRLNNWAQVRSDHEQRIWRASKRGDITTTESMALLRIADLQLKEFTKGEEAAGPVHQVDSAAVEKMNPATLTNDKLLADKYKHTTPHGREIMRKKLYTLKKEIRANDGIPNHPSGVGKQ